MRVVRAARSLAELDEPPELVVIAVPADEVPDVATEAAEHGAKALLILTAGFADRGDEGRELEERVLEIVRGAGLRMVGPNCFGVLNTDPAVSLNATFAGASVPAGRLAICSQSGAIGIGLLGHAAGRRLGVSSFASLGNRADVSTNDLLELWEEDGRTAAVMLYVETFGNPERFARIAQRVSRRKPSSPSKAAGPRTAGAARRRRIARRRCAATTRSTRSCSTPGSSGSRAARSSSTPPRSSRASPCRAAVASAS